MADNEDARNENVETLKRRGRRRLVGAIALVLAAVIVLPMIFDSEPRQAPPPVSVKIPGEDESGFTPKVTPKSPAQVAPVKPATEAPKPEAAPEPKPEPKPEAKVEPKPEPKPEPKAEPKPAPKVEAPAKDAKKATEAERAKAEAALGGGAQYIVMVGAYADPASVIEQLKQAKVPFYTEGIATSKGPVTRVRAGPYATEAAAQKAHEQIQALGLKPGKVVPKP